MINWINRFRGKIKGEYVVKSSEIAKKIFKCTCFDEKEIVEGVVEIIKFFEKNDSEVNFDYDVFLGIFEHAFSLNISVKTFLSTAELVTKEEKC